MNKIISIILLLSISAPAYSWELYDRIIATVNDTSIIESEITFKFNRLLTLKKITGKNTTEERSRLLDKYIEEVLVEQTAKNESIIISDAKIDNNIEQIMHRMNIPSLEIFKNQILENEKMSFEEYREEMRKSLMSEQVMSIAIGVSPPSRNDAEVWYKKNKKEMGFEINYQQILFRLKNDTFAENKRVNNQAKEVYNKILEGAGFDAMAGEYSEDPVTKSRGGAMGWIPLSNMAKQDLILANNLYKSFLIDKRKIDIVKSRRGYLIVKLIDKRPTSFEAVEQEILNILYQQRLGEQFKKWIAQKRMESDVKIYMKDYIKS